MDANLGTLTLDLVAKIGGFTGPLDKAARESQKKMADIRKSADIAGKAIAGLAVATATGLSVLTVNTVRAANEVTRLAQVSNASTEEFQRYAAGAQAVGIEQDKLGDIFKDVNDKVGDFLQTGGGALADFFENVAPRVGVTADQFRKLSGPEALGLYVSSLEKAGASQQDMTFYLEAIASDATALLPLLRDGSKGFKTFGDAAAAAGAIMDEETIRASNEVSAAIWLIEKNATGLKNEVAKNLLPVLATFAGELSDTAVNGSLSKIVADDLASSFRMLAKFATGAVAGVHLLGIGLETLSDLNTTSMQGADWWEKWVPPARIYRAYENFEDIKNVLDEAGVKFDATALGYGDLIRSFDEPLGDRPASQISNLADMLQTLRGQMNQTGTSAGIVIDQNSEKTKKATEAIQSQIEALQLQAATLGMTTREQTLFKLALDGATQSQLDQAAAALDAVDAFDQVKKQQEDYKSLVSELRTEEEQLTDQLKERLRIIESMPDLPDAERREQASRAVDAAFTDAPQFSGVDASIAGPAGEFMKLNDAEKELENWYQTQLEMLGKFREERADLTAEWDEQELELKQQHEDALANIEKNRQLVALSAAESTFGSLADLAKTFAGEQSALYKTLFLAEKAAAIARATIAIQEGIALAAANPFPLNLAAMASVAAATAGLVGNIAAVGMAHDGIDSVPKTGSWYLEKGERVTTAETSAKLDSTLSRIQADMAGQRSSGRSSGGVTVNQTINTTGRIDRRTSTQMAVDSERQQRIAQARLGK